MPNGVAVKHLNHEAFNSPTHHRMIAQEGEGKKVTGTTEAKEEKVTPGAMPNPSMLIWNSVLVVAILVAFSLAARNSIKKIPKGFSNFAEFVAEQLNMFTTGIIGPEGEKYTPLIGTIFIYILTMNLIGLIPTLHSPTSNITFTLALGVFVFFFVTIIGIKSTGVGPFVMHFMGPKLGKYPLMAPLMFPVEAISYCFRPFTLAIRLFGNIFGEDTILFALAGLGSASIATKWIPFHLPVMLLAVLTALVQAMVFCTLTCIYVALVSHHDEEHGHHDEGHHAAVPHEAVLHHSS